MKRKFYDIVENKECLKLCEKLGFERVFTTREIKIIRGGSLSKNQKIVRTKGVKILLDPTTSRKMEFDSAVAQIAHDKDIAIGFSLDSILNTKGLDRVSLIRNIKFVIELCKKKNAEVILISGAKDVYGMRSPEDLAALGVMFGLTKPQALWAVSKAIEGVLNG